MRHDDEAARAAVLGRYADRAPGDRRGGDETVDGPDPALAETVDALRRLAGRPAPPGTRARIWAQVLAETHGVPAATARTRTGSTGPVASASGATERMVGGRTGTTGVAGGRRGSPRRVAAWAASAGLLIAALVTVLAQIWPNGDNSGAGGRQTAVMAAPSARVAVSPAASPAGARLPLDALSGTSGLWDLPSGGADLSIRLIRYTLAADGRWTIPDPGDGRVDWWLVEGMLSLQDGSKVVDWTPTNGYQGVRLPGTELTNRRSTPAVLLEVRVEAGTADPPASPGTTVETLAGGSVGPIDGQRAAVTAGTVWGSQIVDTTRGGAALVVVGSEAVTFYRDGGELVTGGAVTPDDYGSLSIGPGGWALLSSGAAFHFDAPPPEVAKGPSALLVTISPNTAVGEEHEEPTPTPTP